MAADENSTGSAGAAPGEIARMDDIHEIVSGMTQQRFLTDAGMVLLPKRIGREGAELAARTLSLITKSARGIVAVAAVSDPSITRTMPSDGIYLSSESDYLTDLVGCPALTHDSGLAEALEAEGVFSHTASSGKLSRGFDRNVLFPIIRELFPETPVSAALIKKGTRSGTAEFISACLKERRAVVCVSELSSNMSIYETRGADSTTLSKILAEDPTIPDRYAESAPLVNAQIIAGSNLFMLPKIIKYGTHSKFHSFINVTGYAAVAYLLERRDALKADV